MPLLNLAYFHGGLQLDRRHLPIAVVTGVCYLVILVEPGYAWTLAGMRLASALIWQERLGTRTHDVSH